MYADTIAACSGVSFCIINNGAVNYCAMIGLKMAGGCHAEPFKAIRSVIPPALCKSKTSADGALGNAELTGDGALAEALGAETTALACLALSG